MSARTRQGGQVWGRYPFHEAAFLGGPDGVRSLRRHRGHRTLRVYFNAEFAF